MTNPFSTGGGGTNFEQKVGTIYLVSLLARHVPYGTKGITKEIRFQQLHTDILDDLIVVTQEGNIERKLSLQIKHKINFTDSDVDFTKIIKDCWLMFTGQGPSTFDLKTDRLGIGLGIYKTDVAEHLIPLLKLARKSSNATDFFSKVENIGFSQKKKQFLKLIKSKIPENNPSPQKVWQFLTCLEIIHFDLENDESNDVVSSWNTLVDLLQEHDVSTATSLFDYLFSTVSTYNPSAGSITYQELRDKCSNFPLIENFDLSSDIKQLKIHAENSLKLIQDHIAEDIHFDRIEIMNEIHQLLDNYEIVILHGEPLVGKSVIIKMLAQEFRNEGDCVIFSVDRLENNSLQSFLHQLNIEHNFEDILHSFRNTKKKCIFIDGLENATNENKRRIVNEILIAVRDHNSKIKSFNGDPSQYWKIICSSRTLDIEKILLNLETNASIQNKTLKQLKIEGLSLKEKEEVIKKKPNLESLINKENLQELFSRPGILNLACSKNFPTEKQIIEQINSESQFMAVFWEHVICRDNELVSGRGTPLDREKLVLDLAKQSLLGNKKTKLDSGIEYESFVGLQNDRIIRQEDNLIYFVHDYMEDWAWAFLLKNEFENIFDIIQNQSSSLRIISSFRLFSQFLLEVEENPEKWINLLQFLQPKIVSPRWESEWIASPLLSPNFESIFSHLSDYLIKNENELLVKLLTALRLACISYDIEKLSMFNLKNEELIRALPSFAIPQYDKWKLILKFLLSNFEKFDDGFLLEYSKISRMWMEKTHGNESLREELAEKNLELLSEYLLYSSKRDRHNISYDDENELRKNLVYSVFHASDIIPNKVDSFIRFHTISKTSHDYHRIDEFILKNGWIPICRDLPQTFVEVMTAILCQNLKPTRYGWGTLDGLGINHDMDWLTPSPMLEPFYLFLRLHNKEGLRLIQKITNHSTLAWRIREREQRPVVQILRLGNKVLNLWGDERVFRWYRFPSLGSHAVCCALMALEKWLDESIKAGEDPQTLFNNVLSETNCVAMVGVCCSVALANPGKIPFSLLVPILENPAFCLMDERRLYFDSYESKSLLNTPLLFLYTPHSLNFHKRVAEQPHRKLDISQFIPLILLSNNEESKKRLVEKMKNFENNIPIYYSKPTNIPGWSDPKKELADRKRSCRLWALRSDITNYRKVEEDGKIGYAFYPLDHFTEEDHQSSNIAEEHLQLFSYRSWAHQFLVNNEIKPTLTIETAIKRAKELEKTLESKDDYYIYGLDFITNLAAALIVQKWDYVVEKNLVEWCESKITEAGKIQSGEIEVGINPESFDRAIAYSLPFLYTKIKNDTIKYLLESFAQHRVNEVRNTLFYNLQILWDFEPKFVWKCINNLIKISTNGKKLTNCNPKETYSSILLSILFVIPNDQKLIKIKEFKKILKLLDELLDFTINSYHEFQKEGDYNEWDHFEWNRIFFAILANAILHSDEKFRIKITDKIFASWKESPAILEEFLRQFLLVGMKNDLERISYQLWNDWCTNLLQSDDLNGYWRYYKKDIVGLLIFDDALVQNEWKDIHNFWLEKHIPLIQIWCKRFGTHAEYFPSIIKILNSIGFALVYEYGIGWLEMIISEVSDKKKFLKESRSTSELDSLLWKTWEKFGNKIKENTDILNQFSFLVDVVAQQEKPLSNSLQKILEEENKN